jgi:hypothetical protein
MAFANDSFGFFVSVWMIEAGKPAFKPKEALIEA